MTDVSRLHRVTRIRGELVPRPKVTEAVATFLDNPDQTEKIKMYTTAQVVVNQDMYHGHAYDRQLHEVDRQLAAQRMASQVFRLGPPLHLVQLPKGAGRLFFSVRPADAEPLRNFREQLETIHGLEDVPTDDRLYIEFARGALASDMQRRRAQFTEGAHLLASSLHHPTSAARMTATGLHVVFKDMSYRLTSAEDGSDVL